jgi:RNA polymerase sigma-70 factor (ECF subfamily)
MSDPAAEGPLHLERFWSYLRLLAQLQLDPRLRGKLDPSDIVQQTLVRAFQGRDGLRTQGEAAVAAWLTAEQSPSRRAERNEQLLRLAEALEAVPEAQREAVTLHHLHHWTLEDGRPAPEP